jgi:2-methylcitrate dehydratase PrpD
VRARPTRGYEGRFSMPFCLAMTLVYGTVTPNDFVDERLQDPRIQNLIQRTRHIKEESLTVVLKNGTKFSEPFQPITSFTDLPQVQEKFVQNVGGIFPQERAQSIIDRIGDLEELSTIQQLTNLLRTN